MALSPKQILLRGPNWIGDHIMAAGFYRRLRTLYPEAHITFVCPPPVAELSELTSANKTVVLTSSYRSFPFGYLRLGKKLRSEAVSPFDLGITLPSSFSGSFLLFAARAKQRVGYASGGSEIFLSSYLTWPGRTAKKHKTQLYDELADFLSATVSPSFKHTASKSLPREKMFVLAPGASIPLREWPYVSELCRALRSKYPDFSIYVVGTEKEKKWSPALLRIGDTKIVDRIGETSLKQVTALCQRAALVIANDSGIAHVAATLANAPTLVLFGPGDPKYVAPEGRVTVSRISLPCSPCEKPYCRAPYGYQRCLRSLDVDEVMRGVRDSLSFDEADPKD